MMKIGDWDVEIPVIQGGMGVGVSLSGLAGNVAKCGGIGIISTAQIGFRDSDFSKHPIECNLKTIGTEIKKAKEIADGNGYVGVNIMVVTQRYEDYVKAAVLGGADCIISGAGLPMELPGIVEAVSEEVGMPKNHVKLIPIVSGKRALKVILQYWKKHFNVVPDAVVVEGPKAGGHLGFSREELDIYADDADKEISKNYDDCLKEILEITVPANIPTIMAGGIYDREDMMHYMDLGVSGVQVATRFVTTYECDASEQYKQTYINAKKEDIEIVKSPVGMPGRAIHNRFLERVANGERFMNGCKTCITTCKPAETPYCITQALINAVEGKVEEGLLFCGSNAYKATKLEHVKDIMEEFRI